MTYPTYDVSPSQVSNTVDVRSTAGGGVLAPPVPGVSRVHVISATEAYRGDALDPNTPDDSDFWRIRKIAIDFTTGTATTTWADGSAGFICKWSNRAAYSYTPAL